MKILQFPELRQIFCYDCGACALSCILAYNGIDQREDCIMKMAGTTGDGTSTSGIIRVLDYFGLEYVVGILTIDDLKQAIDQQYPTIITLQAYKTSSLPYTECWDDGHYVVAIGYDAKRIFFEDPSSYKRTWLSHLELSDRWHDVDLKGKIFNWGCTVKSKPKFKPNESIHME
jgi:ABC-type bacteriocin/lantibiotic exporter with double-glycine peptidase domain